MSEKKIGIIDIGTSRIKLLVISLDNQNYIQIHSKQSVMTSGVKRGNVIDVNKLSFAIRQCVASSERELKFNLKEIYVGLNSQNFQFKTFGLSRNIGSYQIENKKDLQNLINIGSSIFYQDHNDQEIIHFINSGFYLDKNQFVDNPIGLKSKSLEVILSIISLDKNIIENFDTAFKLSGLKVKKYFYSPYASSMLSADQEDLEKGFVNIDFGYDKTSVTIFDNSNIVFSKILPIGSNHINNDLMKSIDIDKAISEKIKKNYEIFFTDKREDFIKKNLNEKKISAEMIIKIIDARIEEIVEYIQRTLVFCKSKNKAANKIIISGGGSNLKRVKNKLEKFFNGNINYATQSFPIKNTEFDIFSDYMVCLGIAKLIYFPNKNEIKSYQHEKKGFFNKFYSLFLKS